MLQLIVLFLVVMVLVFWIMAAVGGIVIVVPFILIMWIGHWLGLNWWQSLLSAALIMGLAQAMAERYYAWHFRKHAAELDLPYDLLGRQIEIEGKLAKILGSTGNKIVVRKKGDTLATKIDRRLARQKAGL